MYIPRNVPEDQRYSEEKIKEIRTKLGILRPELNIGRFTAVMHMETGDLHGQDLYDTIKFIQDDKTQNIIKEIKKDGNLSNPLEGCKIEDYKERAEVACETAKYLEKLQSHKIINQGKINEEFDNEYFLGLDVKMLDGYKTYKVDEYEKEVDDLRRRTRPTPEQMSRRFTI